MKLLIAILLQAALTHAQDMQRLEIITPPSGVRQQVNAYTQQLEDDLSRAQTQNDKYRALNRATYQLKILKENALTQTLEDDGYMELMIAVMDSVPRGRAFHKEDCDLYRNDLLNEFEPLAEEEPEEPAVKPGWSALQAFCR